MALRNRSIQSDLTSDPDFGQLSSSGNSSKYKQNKLVPNLSGKKVLLFSACVLLLYQAASHRDIQLYDGKQLNHIKVEPAYDESKQESFVSEVKQCTPDQLAVIQTQLPPNDCVANKNQPWVQGCSFTYATRCPDANWLYNYYKQLHRNTKQSQKRTFVGIFIGCNKGMDAVNAMRMGSGNSIFDKSKWRDAITQGGRIKLSNAVCGQDKSEQFNLEDKGWQDNSKFAQLHCVEAMPGTATALEESARQLAWDQHGFVVTHAAMSRRDGSIPFPVAASVGVENKGIGNCKEGHSCVNVTMYSLDTFVTKFVPENVPINYLSVDVEGYDMDVLLGGMETALSRVHYFEFEYNWMGSWKNQHLLDLVELLDHQGFTCYWPGFNNYIWRITGCWLEHYAIHFWSNVACVNRNAKEAQSLAKNMEQMFEYTLSKGRSLVMDHV
ncbi:hypothetical protein HJC23_001309 [Cyclotella cryptica]|uniref:Methyltransferase FkbM domain-containing protein n=1 Tax=Cyclotella cryptica TaxID=29204 RepID=A0ABD3P309_9STRA|eukprot:CCRYP_018189-RA/>CCRYP_018189-RA protein AED:0.10 eAED:0.10 QI:0/-1/0/1/-1/1/1/0/438